MKYLAFLAIIAQFAAGGEKTDSSEVEELAPARIFEEYSKERILDPYVSPLHRFAMLPTIKTSPSSSISTKKIKKVLVDYKVIPKMEWLHSCHHIAASVLSPEHFLLNDKPHHLDIRPGGLAILFFDDGTYCCLAKELQPGMKRKPPNN